MEEELQITCPKHCAHQPERASVRFDAQVQNRGPGPRRLMNNPGKGSQFLGDRSVR